MSVVGTYSKSFYKWRGAVLYTTEHSMTFVFVQNMCALVWSDI